MALIFKWDFFFFVKWKKSDVKFEDRFDKYLDPSFFQHRVGVCTLRQSFVCKSVPHWASAYVDHYAKDGGFQEITTGDFRCKFRGIIKIAGLIL